jgi:hypothetical protein
MAEFDDFFERYYPPPRDPGLRETAIVVWNAAVRAAVGAVNVEKDRYVKAGQYEYAAVARDVGYAVEKLVKVRD